VRESVIVITGASGGIGTAFAELAAARGASLSLTGRHPGPLEALAERCGPQALAVVADATARSDVRRVIDRTLERFGHIDVWINNLGQGITRPPSALTDEDIDEMMRVNVKSALYGMQEVLPHFQVRGTGHVINLSSVLGRIPYVIHRSAYSAAKHFLNSLTANFRDEVQASYPNIRFSIVSPGVVRTGFGLNARHGGADSRTRPHSQSAEEVAAAIAAVIDSGGGDVYTLPGTESQVAKYYAEVGRDI